MKNEEEGELGTSKMDSILRPSETQFSCTCLQFEFDKKVIKNVIKEAKKRGFRVVKRGNDYNLERAIKADLDLLEDEYCLSYYTEEDAYQVPDDFERALDCLRLVFIGSDLASGTSMDFGDPVAKIEVGTDYRLNEDYYGTDWIFSDITYRCNLKCDFCYTKQRNIDIEPEEFERILREFKKKSKEEEKKWKFIKEKRKIGITLGGGEATLHPRLEKILEIAKKYGDYLTISTNGTDYKIIKKYGDLFDGVAVSAPFVYKDSNSPFQYPLEKEKTMEAISEISSKVKRVCLSTIVTNFMEPDDVFRVEEFASKSGATELLFLLYKPGLRIMVPGKEQGRKILEKILEVDFRKMKSSVDVCLAKLTTWKHCLGIDWVGPDANEIKKEHCPFGEKCYVDYFRKDARV